MAEESKAAKPTTEAKTQVKQEKPKEEKQTNCLSCNKPIKKLKRYYRNGKFYCNKKCWRKSITAAKPATK